MRKRDKRWLRMIAQSIGIYPGERADMIPAFPAARLHAAGFIERWTPGNPVYKERWVITANGRQALGETDA